jgi:hypothetical protein
MKHDEEVPQMARRSRLLRWAAVVLVMLAVFAAGCSSESGGTKDSDNDSSSPQEYSIEISQNGQHVTDVTLSQLHTLPEVSFTAIEKTQTGPSLLSVLHYAGITEFSQVKVSGWSKGRVATAELPLDRDEITDQVILEFNNQGKTKLAGPNIPDSNWIIDVEAIEVE